MRKKVYILFVVMSLGLAGQSVSSWIVQQKYQTVLLEEESNKNEMNSEIEKEKFFEYPIVSLSDTFNTSLFLLIKENVSSSLFISLPERPPKTV